MEQSLCARDGAAAWHAIRLLLTSEFRNTIERADCLLWGRSSPASCLEIDHIDGKLSLFHAVITAWDQLQSRICEMSSAEGARDALVFILEEIAADMLHQRPSSATQDGDRATASIETALQLAINISRLSVVPAGTASSE